MQPDSEDMQQVRRESRACATLERRFVRLEEGVESGEEICGRDLQVEEEVGNPGGGADGTLELVRVALEQGDEVGDGKCGGGEVETGAEGTDDVGDALVGRGVAAVEGVVVGLLEQGAPNVFDIDGVAVVGDVVDQEAQVVVAGAFGVRVVKLRRQCASPTTEVMLTSERLWMGPSSIRTTCSFLSSAFSHLRSPFNRSTRSS